MRISIIFIALLLFNCGSSPTEEQLIKINGYWEIEKVVLADGFEKEYEMNTTVDYFMLEAKAGYRKKVQPLFDGTFDTSDDAQAFEINQIGTAFELHYKNDMTQWVETIEKLTEASLVLKNKEGVTYYYKKFEPIKLDIE